MDQLLHDALFAGLDAFAKIWVEGRKPHRAARGVLAEPPAKALNKERAEQAAAATDAAAAAILESLTPGGPPAQRYELLAAGRAHGARAALRALERLIGSQQLQRLVDGRIARPRPLSPRLLGHAAPQ